MIWPHMTRSQWAMQFYEWILAISHHFANFGGHRSTERD